MTAIERLTEDDWERLRDLRLRALRSDGEAFGSSLAREEGFREMHWRMRLRASPWYVAVHDGRDAGLVCVIEEPGAEPSERHVVSLWVAPEVRRRGVARSLLDAAAEGAAAVGATRLTLWRLADQEGAGAAYRACGFAPTGEAVPLHRDPSRVEERWAREIGGALSG